MAETTIKVRAEVTGLSDLEKAKSLLESIGQTKISPAGVNGLVSEINKVTEASKKAESSLKRLAEIKPGKIGNSLVEGIQKASEQASKLEAKLKSVGDIKSDGVGSKMSEGLVKASESANKLKATIKEVSAVNGERFGLQTNEALLKATGSSNKIKESIRQSVQAQSELASNTKKVMNAEKEAAAVFQKGTKARQEAMRSYSEPLSGGKQPGKIRSALKEAFGMYTLGQLGANAVMAAGDGFKNLLKGGLDYISEQQSSNVAWSSNARAVNQLLGRRMSTRQANRFAKGMVSDLTGLAASAGNDYKMVSDAALAFYATGAGVSTAGNKKKTLQLTKDMLNLQDAGGMNDEEMGRFIQSVARTLDQDKITGNCLNQLKQFNSNIEDYLEKAHKKRTGRKGTVRDFTGDDLVEALHMMGMAPGISNASKRMNQSLAGVRRSTKYGLKRMTGEFEKKVGEGLNKAFGGDGKLFSRITGWFNNKKATEGFVNQLAKKTTGVVTTTGKVAREAYNVGKDVYNLAKPYAKTFIGSFADTFKSVGRGLSTAYNTIKGYGQKIANVFPKGLSSRFNSVGQSFSSMAGKATAFLTMTRGLTKIPLLGKGVERAVRPLLSLTEKIPVVGKGLTSIISKITGIKPRQELSASKTMQSAANTMMEAANRMNGSATRPDLVAGKKVPQSKGYGDIMYNRNGEPIGFWDGEGGSLYYDAKGRVKRPASGKGAFKGEYDPWLGADFVEGSPLSTRMARYHTGGVKVPTPRSNKLMIRGYSMLDQLENTRAGLNTSMRGIKVLYGKSLIKAGEVGERVATSFVGRSASMLGRGIRTGAGAVGKYGMPGVNALFAGMEAMAVLGSTQKGSLARHKGVGKAVGSGIGSTLGMVAGGVLGAGSPAAIMAGGIAGDWLGGAIGGWIGGKTGGSKSKPRKTGPTWSQRQQSKAEAQYNKDNFIQGYNDVYKQAGAKPTLSGKRAYSLLNSAQKSSAKARTAAMHYQDAVAAGDVAGMAKYQSQMQRQVEKQDNRDIRSASSRLSKAKRSRSKAYNKAFDEAMRSLSGAEGFGMSKSQKRKIASARARSSKGYKSAKKAVTKASKAHSKAISKYEKDTGKKYKGSLKMKTSGGKQVSKLLKSAKKVKGTHKSKVSAKVSGDKKVDKLSKSMKKVKGNKKAKVTAKVSGDKKVSKLSKSMKKVKNKKAKVKVSTTGEKKVTKLSKSMKKVKNKHAKVAVKTSGSSKVKKLSSDIRKVKGKNAKVSVRVSGTGKVNSLKSAIARVKNKTAKVTAQVTGKGKVDALRSAIRSLKGKSVSVSAKVSGTSAVRSLVSAIAAVRSKHVTISATVSKHGHLATGTPGASRSFGVPALATGTPAATTNKWSSNGGTKKGIYLVNDSPDSDFVEAFKTKDGTIGLFPRQRNLLVPLAEGTQVLNAKETKKRFPKLEKGTKKFDVPEHADNSQTKNNKTTGNVINITVNVNGGGFGTSATNLGNTIANAIGEKLRQQFPLAEI